MMQPAAAGHIGDQDSSKPGVGRVFGLGVAVWRMQRRKILYTGLSVSLSAGVL